MLDGVMYMKTELEWAGSGQQPATRFNVPAMRPLNT